MPRALLASSLAVVLAACAPTAPRVDVAPDAATIFVARLGADTVAVERVVRDAQGVNVTLVTRVPTAQRTEARLDLDPAGRMLAYASETRDADGAGCRTTWTADRAGDSLRVQAGDAAPRMLAASRDALPFVEYAHASFDLALRRGTDGPLPMATERSVLDFTVTQDGQAATVRHPFRSDGGHGRSRRGARHPHAAETTRKPWLARARARRRCVHAPGRRARRRRSRDRTPLGTCRDAGDRGGRDDHPRPRPAVAPRAAGVGHRRPLRQRLAHRRGRRTHLTTDRPLVLGRGASTLRIPAGTVTLFSVPQADGGVLIVNGQTGQNGNRYDPTQDLGRVLFALDPLAAPVERLEIVAEPDGDGGRLVIRWGDRALSVPFRTE